MAARGNVGRQMEVVFAEENCVLSVDADAEDDDPDVIVDTLIDALAAGDANEAERLIRGAVGRNGRVERR